MNSMYIFKKTQNMQAKYIQETPLFFRNGLIDIDQKRGLTLHGPSDSFGDDIQTIRVGVVSDSEGIEIVTSIFNHLNDNIIHSNGENPFISLSFPGFNKAFKSKILFHENYNDTLLFKETSSILDIENPNLRIKRAAELYAKKVLNICDKVTVPDVIICHKPKEIEEKCGGVSLFESRTKGLSSSEKKEAEKIRKNVETHKILSPLDDETKDFIDMVIKANFRRILKSKIMEKDVPIQIITQSTIESLNSMIGLPTIPSIKHRKQDSSTIAWNLAVALYYKANHFPWKVGNLKKGSCYIGISFFYDQTTHEKNMFASLAQIFSDTGEGMIVRGDSFHWDTKDKGAPHLTKEAASKLLLDAINLYEAHHNGQSPNRVVIHKSSRYDKFEKEGFRDSLEEVPRFDFVCLSDGSEYFFYRNGSNAVLRGTFIQLPNKSSLVFTTGYVPYLKSYNAPRIPKPIEISEHHGDTPVETIASEILALTRLDWNTTRFNSYKPITLKFAYRVGQILSNIPQDAKIQHQYRYYM